MNPSIQTPVAIAAAVDTNQMDETLINKLPPPNVPLVAPPGANDISGATFGSYRLVRKSRKADGRDL